eukprot:11224980-Lingulodinium_polyedra.AAC.1
MRASLGGKGFSLQARMSARQSARRWCARFGRLFCAAQGKPRRGLRADRGQLRRAAQPKRPR